MQKEKKCRLTLVAEGRDAVNLDVVLQTNPDGSAQGQAFLKGQGFPVASVQGSVIGSDFVSLAVDFSDPEHPFCACAFYAKANGPGCFCGGGRGLSHIDKKSFDFSAKLLFLG